MSQNIFNSSRSAVSRDQRWEARRQAKFNQSSSIHLDPEIKVAEYNTDRPSTLDMSYPMQDLPPPSYMQNFNPNPNPNPNPNANFNSNFNQNFNPNPNPNPNPNSNSNPVNFSLPPVESTSSNRLITESSVQQSPNAELIKRKAYGIELQRQIEDEKRKKKRQPTPNKDYFPFGKQGAGAPMRDDQGNIIAKRPPKLNENDPNFMNPAVFYKNVAGMNHSRSQQVVGLADPRGRIEGFNQQATPPKMVNGFYQNMPGNQYQSSPGFQFQPVNANQPPPGFMTGPIYQQNPNYGNAHGYNNPQNFQPGFNYQGGGFSQQRVNENVQYGNQFNPYEPPQVPVGYPGERGNQHFVDLQQIPKNLYTDPSNSDDRIYRQSSDSPKPFVTDPSEDNQKSLDRIKKQELGKVLLQQADEKRRRQEEEKRQKILEERLEEERLAKQRREIELQRQMEEMKGRKKFQEVQEYNGQAVIEVKNKPKRQRTPYEPQGDFPPAMPHGPNPGNNFANNVPPLQPLSNNAIRPPLENQAPINLSSVPMGQMQERRQEVTVGGPTQSHLDDQYLRLKQEYESRHNLLKQEIINLKSDHLDKESKHLEAQRELQRLKDEFRQKDIMDEIRQKEVLLALHNTKSNHYDPPTKLPAYKPLPYKEVEGRGDASLSLDPYKSLPSSSKLIPLPNPEMNFPTNPIPESNFKRALGLDSLFPSLPEADTLNVSVTSNVTAGSSIGIEKLSKKNDERLKYLEKVEKSAGDSADELKKLDEILFKFQPSHTSMPPSRESIKPKRLDRILEVDEADYSLPRSRASGLSEASLKWNKDWNDM